MTVSFVTSIRVLLLEVRPSDVQATLLWVQLIIFMRKVMLLKVDSFTSFLALFPDEVGTGRNTGGFGSAEAQRERKIGKEMKVQ